MSVRMRWSIFAATLLWFGPAQAEWKEYALPDAGAALQFPGEPRKEVTKYTTEVVGAAGTAALTYTAEEDGIRYRLTVADLRAPNLFAKGANIMAECYFLAEQEGEVRSNMPARAQDGTPQGVHGRWVAVELRGMQGNKQTACFFAGGRLFRADALIPPSYSRPEAPNVSYFLDSLRITGR